MRYAQIRNMDISNGSGIGIALYVQGCHFHCRGCFNQDTWDFDGGKPWTPEKEREFLALLDKPWISRVSILGGEPMERRNLKPLIHLINEIHRLRSDVNIWVYTGYEIEELLRMDRDDYPVKELINKIDYLVDGQFQLDKQDVNHMVMPFAGSTNQRVLSKTDIKKFHGL